MENLGDLSEFDIQLYDNNERRKGLMNGYAMLQKNANNLSDSIAKIDRNLIVIKKLYNLTNKNI